MPLPKYCDPLYASDYFPDDTDIASHSFFNPITFLNCGTSSGSTKRVQETRLEAITTAVDQEKILLDGIDPALQGGCSVQSPARLAPPSPLREGPSEVRQDSGHLLPYVMPPVHPQHKCSSLCNGSLYQSTKAPLDISGRRGNTSKIIKSVYRLGDK